MTVDDAIKSSLSYRQITKEADETQSYMIVSPDTTASEALAISVVSLISGIREDEVAVNKDVFFLPFGDKVLKDDVDFITTAAYVMPSELSKKFFIVRYAETSNETAQNKLLKTLEEPPETAVLILLCANEYAMLPTVRSRCRIIRPQPFSDETLKEILSSERPACINPSFCVAMASGQINKLLFYADEGSEVLDVVLKLLVNMRKSSEILPFAAALTAKKEKLGEILDVMELVLRDCMAVTFRPELVKLKGNVMDIKELSAVYVPDAVIKIMPVLIRAKKRITAGGNVNSIVDELLFSILEEKAKCQRS